MNYIQMNDGSRVECSKIVAVGRNYGEHIEEMKAQRTKDPVLFLKPSTALCPMEEALIIPRDKGAVHYELELAVVIGKKAQRVAEDEALDYVRGYGMALDLTLRDVQSEAKKAGLPWSVAKGFDRACPVSRFADSARVNYDGQWEVLLEQNGEVRQKGNTGQMIFPLHTLISYISHIFTLLPGDVVLTGTPAGVGPLTPGDKIRAVVGPLPEVKTAVAI